MKTLFLSALMLGVAAVSYAGNPKGDAKPAVAEIKTETAGSLKWFEFTGTPEEINDATKYNEITSPECDENVLLPYRCEIQIQSQGTSPDRPDLSQPVVSETRKDE